MNWFFAFCRWVKLSHKRQIAKKGYKKLSLHILMRILKTPESDTVKQLFSAFADKASFQDLMTIIKDKERQYPIDIREMTGIHALWIIETSIGSELNSTTWLHPVTGRVAHLINIVTCLPQLADRATRVTFHFLHDEKATWQTFLQERDFPEGPPPLRLITND